MDKVKQGLRRRSTQLRQQVPRFSRKTSRLEPSPPRPGSENRGQGIDQALRPASLPKSSISIREPMTGSAASIPPVVSVPCLMAPSPHAVSDVTAQENLTPGVLVVPGIGDSRASPWRQAFKKLSDRDKAAFPFTNTDKREYIERILEATKASRDTYQRNRLKFTFRGNNIIVRDVADGLLTWLEKFKQVGDIAIQHDPVHAALPWAGIRLLLQIAVNNKEAMEAVLIGVERIARPLVRCAVYEKLYLNLVPRLSIHKNLEGALGDFYVAVLRFLAFAKKYLDINRTKRVLNGLLNVDGKSYFDSIENRESLLLIEVAAAEAEMRQHNHTSLEGMNEEKSISLEKKLMKMLEIEKPLSRIDLNVKLMREESRDYIQEKKRRKVLQWLSQIKYEKHHQNAKERLLENTGQWLFDKNEFCEWRSSGASGILWLHGIPGAGKTKLICTVIDTLKSTSPPDEPVVYFYCSRNEPQRRDPTRIMQAIVKQLSVVLHELPKTVVAEYDEREKRGSAAGTLGFQESCDFVVSLLEVYPQVTIIIDALDESDPEERGRLLEALRSLIQQSPRSLTKIFVSSRDDIDIKLELEKVPNLYIEANDNSGDIGRFIRRDVTQSISKKRLLRGNVSDELREQIISTIEEGSKGMFQWADLQIKNLYKMKLEDDVRDGLGKLPKTLEETYAQIWGDISSGTLRELEFTIRALMWVMCSQRPLNKEEWAQASYWPKPAPTDATTILFDLCRNLVAWDRQLDCVVLVHLSVREYLENRVFSSIDANLMAAESCLSLLDDPSYWPIVEKSVLKPLKRTFIIYSVVYWAGHVECAYGLSMSKPILDLLQHFLGTVANPGEAYCRWKRNADILQAGRWQCSEFGDTLYHLESTPLNTLFALSYFRFGEQLKEQWESESIDINSKNSAGETILFVASMQGNEWVMDLLLKKGSDVNAGHSKYYSNSLIAAIKGGHERAVIKLVDAGASIYANDGGYTDILEAAVSEDKKGVIKAIVTRDIKILVTSATVIAGNRGGELETIGLLLSRDANTEFTNAAFIEVARRFDENIMQMLLTKNPNIEITEAAIAAAAGNYQAGYSIIKLLLSKSPRIMITDVVVMAAGGSERGRKVMQLLARGTNIEFTETAVVEIARRFDKSLMQILLAKNSNIDTTNAITAAAENKQSGHRVIELLLPINPNVSTTEAAIVAAAGNEVTGYRIIEVLSSNNLNITITEAAVRAAAGRESDGFLKLLLARDTNSEITEAAAVEIAKSFGERTTQMLLTKNPKIAITKAAIAVAARNKHRGYNTTKLLLSKNPNNTITGTAITAAAEKGRGWQVVQLLLDRDTKITEAAVVEIARRFDENIMAILLTKDQDINPSKAIQAAAANLWSGRSVIELLFYNYPKVEITEAIIVAAAGNQLSGCGIIELLLSKNPNITISDAVVRAAVDQGRDREVMKLLLARDTNTKITDAAVVEISKRCDQDIMQMLLAKNPNTEITEAVVIAAAENFWSGKKVMQVLLTKKMNIVVTEAVVTAAAGNKRIRREMTQRSCKVTQVFLTNDAEIEVTKAIVTPAAENKRIRRKVTHSIGREIMQVLLATDIEITEAAVIEIARKFDKDMIQRILAKNPSKITKEVIAVMAVNGWSSEEILELQHGIEDL